jgi:hypothetical protein
MKPKIETNKIHSIVFGFDFCGGIMEHMAMCSGIIY